MKKFIPKKKLKINYMLILLIIAILFCSKYIYTNIMLVDDEKMFIDLISKDSTYANLYKVNDKNIVNKLFKNILNIDINKPINMLKKRFIYSNITSTSKEVTTEYPLVYIYNTHQKEEYDGSYVNEYNIKPGVLMASYILKNKLEQYGINTIVEETDIYKHMENYDFTNPYSSTRQLVAHVVKENPNLKLIIDLHRDSPTKQYTTTTINNKKYAQTLFVHGVNYLDNQENRKIVEILNSKLNKYYPTLSRGIYNKEDDYNQYINNHMILLEVGGYQNTIEEVTNSLDAIAMVIKEYIEEY